MLTREDIGRALSYLATAHPESRQAKLVADKQRTQDLQALVTVYHDVLKQFPPLALEEATKRVVQKTKWFPKPAELVAECHKEMEHGPGVLARFEQVGIVREIPAPVSLALLEEGDS